MARDIYSDNSISLMKQFGGNTLRTPKDLLKLQKHLAKWIITGEVEKETGKMLIQLCNSINNTMALHYKVERIIELETIIDKLNLTSGVFVNEE